MGYIQVAYEVVDGVAMLTLDRPDRLNAFTQTMAEEILDALDRVDHDDGVQALVVTGRGTAFCAGADLSGGAETFHYRHRGGSATRVPRDRGGRVTLRLFELRKPVVAAINGAAVGVGAAMLLPMDVRLASTTALLAFPYARRGIAPESCSSWFLPRVVAPATAAEWLYMGRRVSADEAVKVGLIRELHPVHDLLQAAVSAARDLVSGTAPVSVAFTRQLLWRGLTFASPYQTHVAESRGLYYRGQSQDVVEGISSFLQRRAARFPDTVEENYVDIFDDLQPELISDSGPGSDLND